MKKEWLNPEVKSLNLNSTKEDIEDCTPEGVQEFIFDGFLGTCKVKWCVHRGHKKFNGYCYCHQDLAGNDEDNTVPLS